MTLRPDITPGELALPRPPGVIRRWLATHPRTVDWIIVGFYLFGAAVMIVFEALSGLTADFFSEVDPEVAAEVSARADRLQGPWLLVMLCSTGLIAVALKYRRRFALAGLIVVLALMYFDLGMLVVPNSVALVFLLYAIPVHRGVRAGWIGFGIAAVSGAALIYFTGWANSGLIGADGLTAFDGPFDQSNVILLSIMNALWLLAVLMIGINLGNRRRYVEALIDRAHQLAREREQRAQLAAVSERSRIAREMHDIVAHSLSVVVTLSEAAAVSIDTQPDAAKRATQQAAETGRNALVEMRRLLGVLNENDDPETPGEALRTPQPGTAQLQSLVDGFREAGLNVAFSEAGVSQGDASQQLAVYRIVQEGLTNALRYAGRGTEVQLVLEHTLRETCIEIRDSGKVVGMSESAANEAAEDRSRHQTIPGSGRGLEGAAERARLFGGGLEAGPSGKGWALVATVPTGLEAPRAEESESQP